MIFNAVSRVRVRDAERLWLAKFTLRVVTLLAAVIAIACIAWAFGQYGYSEYTFQDGSLLPWQFISLGISIIWNLANIIVRLSRPRPMHPGANVGMDLLLWMGLIITGLLAMEAGVENLNWYGYEDSYSGESTSPVQNPNGTISYIYGHYGYFQNGTYGFVPDGTPGSDCPGYPSCALKAAAASQIYHLGVVEVVGCAFTFLAVLLHFTLFVWACVDVHRRNNGKVDRRAAAIAQTILAEMAERGVLPSGSGPQQQQQQADPLLAAKDPHARDSSPYDPDARDSMPLGHPTDERDSQHMREYMSVSREEMESFPAPPGNYPVGMAGSRDESRGVESGRVV